MPPSNITHIAEQFGGAGTPEQLSGGQGQSWKTETSDGPIVIKPSPTLDEARWVGETFSQLTFSPGVRVPRPVLSNQGEWIVEGHTAWTWLDGQQADGRYRQKIDAARAFHAGLRPLQRPDFLDRRTDPWAMADRVAWSEAAADYDTHSMEALSPVLSMIDATPAPSDSQDQLIHGDLSGNYVFADNRAPGIIDITPYWRPVGFAEAVIWVDTIWFSKIAEPAHFAQQWMRAFVLRALARRIAEQPEQVAAGMRSAEDAAGTVAKLRAATGRLLEPWPSH
ncbi:MAG: aminoglycoside phosphotransferase [Pseudomonadota bacterium]